MTDSLTLTTLWYILTALKIKSKKCDFPVYSLWLWAALLFAGRRQWPVTRSVHSLIQAQLRVRHWSNLNMNIVCVHCALCITGLSVETRTILVQIQWLEVGSRTRLYKSRSALSSRGLKTFNTVQSEWTWQSKRSSQRYFRKHRIQRLSPSTLSKGASVE